MICHDSNIQSVKPLGALTDIKSPYDPENVIRKAKIELEKYNGEDVTLESNLYRAATLSEFSNGVMLTNVIPDHFRTLGIEMLRQIQKDFNCVMTGEKALAELITVTFIRILELQGRLNDLLDSKFLKKIDLEFFAILGKEIDRANRQYISAIQTLRLMKQPPLQVNVKTDTAIIGQNQVVQENKNG